MQYKSKGWKQGMGQVFIKEAASDLSSFDSTPRNQVPGKTSREWEALVWVEKDYLPLGLWDTHWDLHFLFCAMGAMADLQIEYYLCE